MRSRLPTRIALVVASLGLANSTAAADVTSIEIAAVSVVPVATWRETASTGFGGKFSLDLPLSPETSVRSSLGLVYHRTREVSIPMLGVIGTSLWEVPVLLGARRDIGAGREVRPYVEAQFGAVFSRTRVESGMRADVDTDVALGGLVGLGVTWRRLDVGVALWMPSLADLDDAMGLFVTVGLRLAPISSLP